MSNEKVRRNKKFSPTEVTVLVEEIDRRRSVLFGPLKGPNLKYQRDKEWDKVVIAVNSVAPVVRGREELKKKFKDLKSRTKSKAHEGAPLNPVEERLLAIFGSDSIEGIPAVTDTVKEEVTVINKTQSSSDFTVFALPWSPTRSEDTPHTPSPVPPPVHPVHETEKAVWQEMLCEFREFKEEFRHFKQQFLQLKKRELELRERELNVKRIRPC